MSPETRAFLDSVRTADDPAPEDERRVLAAVRAAATTGALAGAGTLASKSAKLFGGGIASGVKVGGLVLGLSAAAWIASAAFSSERPAAPSPKPAISSRSLQNVPNTADHPLPEAVAPVPRNEKPEANPPAPSRVGVRPAASAPHAASSLRDEIALLAEVQAAIARGDGGGALRKLDQHVSGDRHLLAERRAARILALCSLGRRAEAERAAETFLREHPASVQRTAVERSCAGKSTDTR